MSSLLTLLDAESSEWFQKHRDMFLSRFQPADDFEISLMDQMVAASWRMQRIWAIQSASLNHEMGSQSYPVNADSTLFDSYDKFSSQFDKLSRLEERLSRIYHRALAALKSIQRPQKTVTKTKELPVPVASTEPRPLKIVKPHSTNSTQFDTICNSQAPESNSPPAPPKKCRSS